MHPEIPELYSTCAFYFSPGDTMQDTETDTVERLMAAEHALLLAACQAAFDNLSPRYAIGPMYTADYRVLQQLRAALDKVNGRPVTA